MDHLNNRHSWPVPYLSHLESTGIQPGQTLIIKGVMTGERFDVNLMSEKDIENANIALHISVRAKEKVLLLNSKENGNFGKEERKKDPFKENENIDLRIRAHDSKFEPVPYQSEVDGGLVPGKKLYVTGVPEKKGKGFSVELVNAANEVAFSFDVRLGEKHVVRNAQFNGAWGNEEKAGGKIPFEKDVAFDLMIDVEPYQFQVYVNGNHFCSFAHRTDPKQIHMFRINGDVELQGVYIK